MAEKLFNGVFINPSGKRGPEIVFQAKDATPKTLRILRRSVERLGLEEIFKFRIRGKRLNLGRFRKTPEGLVTQNWYLLNGEKRLPLYGKSGNI